MGVHVRRIELVDGPGGPSYNFPDTRSIKNWMLNFRILLTNIREIHAESEAQRINDLKTNWIQIGSSFNFGREKMESLEWFSDFIGATNVEKFSFSAQIYAVSFRTLIATNQERD